MTLVRIAAVKPLDGFTVQLELTSGEEVVRDLTPLLQGPVFETIRTDRVRFRQVQASGGTLVWPGEIDLCPDAVIWGGLPPASASRAA
jgi:hypothetical protein